MSERSKPRIMSSVDQDKDEILRFIKSYHFTTGRFPKVSHIKQYTTLKYPIVINAIVKELIQDKKVEVLKEGKVNEYEIRLLPTA